MNIYDLVFEKIQELYENNILTLEQCLEVNNLAYFKYITEAEEDYTNHMAKKKINANLMGKSVNELHNKKYDDPEKARKAEAKYAYADSTKYIGYKKIKDDLGEDKVTSIQNRPLMSKDKYGKIVKRTNGGIVEHYKLSEGLKQSDIKKLEYMKKHCNPKNNDELKNYNTAFNMFVQKFGIKPDSSVYIHLDPKNPDNWEGEGNELVEYTKSKDVSIKIPSSMHLVHMSDKDGLTELTPQLHSTKYNKSGKHELSGRYNGVQGRVYFIVLNKNENFKDISSKNKHSYELINVPNEKIFIDKEMGGTHALDKVLLNGTINKPISGMAVYVETDKPLKVRQLV